MLFGSAAVFDNDTLVTEGPKLLSRRNELHAEITALQAYLPED